MAYLHETHKTLSELYANQQQSFGMHLYDDVRAGRQGLFVGDALFDPARHSVTDINHMSGAAEATGMPYVRQVIPSHPLTVNLVVHHATGEEHEDIDRGKQLLAMSIRDSLVESKPNAMDWLHSYLIGDVKEGLTDFDVIDHNINDPRHVQRTLADICASGLGIIISDFENLDLTGVKRRSLAGSVAVKVSDEWDWELPANTGVWTAGDGKEYDTGNPEQLEAYKEAAAGLHALKKAELEIKGLAVADVVFRSELFHRGSSRLIGFNIKEADVALAAAIRQAEKQQ